MGPLITIFIVSIALLLFGEGTVLLGNREDRNTGIALMIIGAIGFIYSFFSIISIVNKL